MYSILFLNFLRTISIPLDQPLVLKSHDGMFMTNDTLNFGTNPFKLVNRRKSLVSIRQYGEKFLIQIGPGLLCSKNDVYESELPYHNIGKDIENQGSIKEIGNEKRIGDKIGVHGVSLEDHEMSEEGISDSILDGIEASLDKKHSNFLLSDDCFWNIIELPVEKTDPLTIYYKTESLGNPKKVNTGKKESDYKRTEITADMLKKENEIKKNNSSDTKEPPSNMSGDQNDKKGMGDSELDENERKNESSDTESPDIYDTISTNAPLEMLSVDIPQKILKIHYDESSMAEIERVLKYRYENRSKLLKIAIKKDDVCFLGNYMGECLDEDMNYRDKVVFTVQTVGCEKKGDKKDALEKDEKSDSSSSDVNTENSEGEHVDEISEDVGKSIPNSYPPSKEIEKVQKALIKYVKKKKKKTLPWKWPAWRGLRFPTLC